jgi:nicotinate phosphoribosyltransferase
MGPSQVYRTSLALLTDFYQLTMAYAAWKGGVAGKEAVFHLSFRRNPFEGGYAVAAGLEDAVDLLLHSRFTEDDLAFLAGQVGADGKRLFEPAFLAWLGELEPEVDVDAVPEGTVVFPHEPLLRVRGPIVPCMLLETPLLAIVNFQTLVATKASRIVLAARGQPVVEFGLRRAQGIDGGLSASRAAYVGGVSGTSNVLAARLHGIPVKGTHAHTWVMIFDDELEAFQAYAKAMPANTVLLVDTYDTLDGVRHAIEAGRWLKAQGHRMAGIRLDSGDLAWLSQQARRLLDEAGLEDTVILASNELDEYVITALHDQKAAIAVWGVGTRLVTGWGEPALGGVYKLSAVRDGPGAPWEYRVKLSEQLAKTTIPGILQVRRFRYEGGYVADVIHDVDLGLPASPEMIDPLDHTRRRVIRAGTPGEDLLVPVIRAGTPVWTPPPLSEVRARTLSELSRFHSGVKRLVHPHGYPVGLERGLHDLRTRLVLEARQASARRVP